MFVAYHINMLFSTNSHFLHKRAFIIISNIAHMSGEVVLHLFVHSKRGRFKIRSEGCEMELKV